MVDLARVRLAEVAHALSAVRIGAGVLAGHAHWQSAAARGFRADADGLAGDLASLEAEVEQLHDDLRAMRTHAAQWGRG